jgi:hypothetical protein
MPVELRAAHGAAVQVHVEHLTAYLAGRELVVAETRWKELEPAYENLAAAAG